MRDIGSLIDEATRKTYELEPKTDRQKMFANQGNAVEGCFPGYENEEWAAVKYSDGTWHGGQKE